MSLESDLEKISKLELGPITRAYESLKVPKRFWDFSVEEQEDFVVWLESKKIYERLDSSLTMQKMIQVWGAAGQPKANAVKPYVVDHWAYTGEDVTEEEQEAARARIPMLQEKLRILNAALEKAKMQEVEDKRKSKLKDLRTALEEAKAERENDETL